MNFRALPIFITCRLVFFLSLLCAAQLPAGEITLPVTADTSISCYPNEQEVSMGDSPRIKMKGIENILLLNADMTLLKNLRITKAVLHLKGTDSNMMVRKVGFSTVACDWKEGQSGGDAAGKPGSACYKTPDLGSGGAWAAPGSCFLDVIWGRSGTIWTQSYVTHDDSQWYTMEFDGRLLEACAAGLSFGLAVSDDNGQTMSIHKDLMKGGNFSNNYFFAREQSNAKPYFTVETIPAPVTEARTLAVTVAPWMGGSDFEHGAAEVSWPGPKDDAEFRDLIGYRIQIENEKLPRWFYPSPAKPGEKARALLAGFHPGAELAVKVEIVTRGGMVSAAGTASGTCSPAFPAPPPLKLAPAPNEVALAVPGTDSKPSVWVVPDCIKVNPLTGNVLEEPKVAYEGEPAGTYRSINAIWDAKDSSVNLSALRGEWVAFQIVCQNNDKDKKSLDWKLTPGALHGPGAALIPESSMRFSRLWYQKIGKAPRSWYADPMLPLEKDEFTVPDAQNGIPGQANQTIYAEWFVPKDAAPGMYAGSINVIPSGAQPVELKIQLQVGAAVMPESAHFTWSMNAYSSPGDGFGTPDNDSFIQAERSFYSMAHAHRTTLAVLQYSHGGKYEAGAAPPLSGSGKDMKVSDWTHWDGRYGPLFDGSAFKDTPRSNLPLDHFYLVLCEHYPTQMNGAVAEGAGAGKAVPQAAYKWNDATWEEHWKVAGPVEEGFSEQYKDQWIAVAKDYIKHINEKGWKTAFQVYLNDKYFYKQYTGKGKNGGGVCFWLLDEPQHIDDFSALAFFGGLMRQASASEKNSPILFRADISRPQWGRDLLDRVIDLQVSGGFSEFRPWLEEWRERNGQRIWTYGGAPDSTASALGIEAQALDLYSRGVDGFVPWLTLGNAQNWKNFEATCVYYTGKPMGLPGACASLRLKAYRRGEQDVEYVWLLASQLGLLKNDPNRRQVAALLAPALKATRSMGKLDAQGAVTESLSGLSAGNFERLRRGISEQLK